MIERPYLFDVTRLVSRSWTQRKSTGLDRVSYAYLERFRRNAQAVVQHKGLARVLTRHDSDRLFALLSGSDARFRAKLLRFAPQALLRGAAHARCNGAIYINVSQTEYDLGSHTSWVDQCEVRPVYLIHDLIPINHPEFCRPKAVDRHRGRVTNALKHASGIIVNSEATAHDLRSFAHKEQLPLPPTRAVPIAGASLSVARTDPPSDRPYFVCVGTIEPRKNHSFLLSTWEQLVAEHGASAPRLVIIGQWGVQSGMVRHLLERSPHLQAHVTVLAQCSDNDLGGWIAGARALLLPTLAEGFGLPLVEAMRLGTPVIASNLPSFRETGQGIPTLLDPSNARAWKLAISSFCRNSADRLRQIAALQHYRAPTWDDHFTSIEDWMASLPSRPERHNRLQNTQEHSPLADWLHSVPSTKQPLPNHPNHNPPKIAPALSDLPVLSRD